MVAASGLFLDHHHFLSSPGIAHEMGGITLIPISMNLGQPPKMEAQASYHPQVSQAQEGHLSSGSKPKKTGSLALFYRKVSIFVRKLCFTFICDHAKNPWAIYIVLLFSLHVPFLWCEQFSCSWEEKRKDVAENSISHIVPALPPTH